MDDRSSSHALSSALSYGLLHFPQLIEEFPSIISSLDANEIINIDAISNVPLREYLHKLFQFLPAVSKSINGGGYYKNDAVKRISGSVLNSLLQVHSIVQPTTLSAGQTLACRSAPLYLLALVKKYPSLIIEIPALLKSLIDGQTVCLNGIDNVDIKNSLYKLLDSVGVKPISKSSSSSSSDFVVMDSDDDDDDDSNGEDKGVAIPTGYAGEAVRIALRDLCRVFEFADSFQPPQSLSHHTSSYSSSSSSSSSADMNMKIPSSKSKKHKRSPSPSSSSSSRSLSPSSSDSESDDENEMEREKLNDDDDDYISHKKGKTIPSVGPIMPTKAQLAFAKSAAEKYFAIEEVAYNDDDDGEGEIGPSSILMTQDYDDNEPLGGPIVKAKSSSSNDVSNDDKVEGREEWMLVPGENKTFLEMTEAKGVTNRKFNFGKDAKRAALQAAKDAKKVTMTEEEKEEQLQTQLLLDEYRKKRGPTLMEQHQEKNGNVEKIANLKERKAFNKDNEFLSHRMINKFQVEQMVNEAKALDSRFDKGQVSKSFL